MARKATRKEIKYETDQKSFEVKTGGPAIGIFNLLRRAVEPPEVQTSGAWIKEHPIFVRFRTKQLREQRFDLSNRHADKVPDPNVSATRGLNVQMQAAIARNDSEKAAYFALQLAHLIGFQDCFAVLGPAAHTGHSNVYRAAEEIGGRGPDIGLPVAIEVTEEFDRRWAKRNAEKSEASPHGIKIAMAKDYKRQNEKNKIEAKIEANRLIKASGATGDTADDILKAELKKAKKKKRPEHVNGVYDAIKRGRPHVPKKDSL